MIGKENKYYFFRDDQKQCFFEFNPSDTSILDNVGYAYYSRVIDSLEHKIKNSGLVFYITAWTVHRLPEYGDNVIALILQDEWGREPRYRHKVKAIFKTCGTYPNCLQGQKFGTFKEKVVNILAFLKFCLKDNGGRLLTLFHRMMGKKIAPLFDIPLGYYNNDTVEFIPFENRNNDFYFAGSAKHTIKGFQLPRPKEIARNRMLSALQDTQSKIPSLNVAMKITDSFQQSISGENNSYLQEMMHTKICPIPRGANLETFRFYEAIRYGCVPIGEAFPESDFYKDAPMIRLKNWSDLPKIALYYKKNPNELFILHQKILAWWHNQCSEEKTADYIFKKINNNS